MNCQKEKHPGGHRAERQDSLDLSADKSLVEVVEVRARKGGGGGGAGLPWLQQVVSK